MGSSSSTTGGIVHEGAGNGDALLQALGECAGTIVGAIVDADDLHDGRHAAVLVWHAVQPGVGEEIGADASAAPIARVLP